MKRLSGLGLLLAAACTSQEAADTVLRNGVVYPYAIDSAPAQAVAIKDGRIVYVGSDSVAATWTGDRTEVIDLKGRTVLPGLHDTHVHPRGGVDLAEITLESVETRQAILDTVRSYAARHPEAPWIRGRGWQLPVFPGANPRKEWLDSIVPDRPVFLSAADGHSSWVNSRALAIAGVTKETKDPPNGRIERDAAGEPTGTLREDASDLVSAHLPKRTQQDLQAGILRALAMANSFGLTTLHEASAIEDLLKAYAALDSAGRLTTRVIAAIYVDPLAGVAQVDTMRAWRARYQGPRYFSASAAKIFADGVIEPKTAALLEPYLGTTSRGEPNLSPAAMDTLVAALDAAGFQVHVHAIGDRAVRMTLDAFGFARQHNGPRDARPIIAHLELIDSTDIPRFAAMHVIPSFQPLWAQPDDYITVMTEPFLGPKRSRWLYPIGSVARSGAPLAAGSDWSVSSMNPFEAIQVAITRRAVDSVAGPAWIPEETVDLGTMLRAYTSGGAYAARQEATNGTLELGKDADLIVVDQDPHRIPVTRLHTVKVLLTLLEGKPVYKLAF